MKSTLSLNKFLLLFFIIFNLIFFFTMKELKGENNNNLKKITSKLRCMTCQNQTIYDSNTDFSQSIKKIVLEKLKNDESEKEIINFLILRYGEYIVFEPQINRRNIFLWYFPFIILAISLFFLFFRIKKN